MDSTVKSLNKIAFNVGTDSEKPIVSTNPKRKKKNNKRKIQEEKEEDDKKESISFFFLYIMYNNQIIPHFLDHTSYM